MPTSENGAGVLGIVLAGGLSSRMGGGDKSLRPLGGRPMLAHVVDRLRPQVDALMINANGDPARFDGFGLPVVADVFPDFAGPLAGVLTGMRHAQQRAPAPRWIATVAADTPFLPLDMVARFKAAVVEEPEAIALAASDEGDHPVFGLWPVDLADDLERALRAGSRKVMDWAAGHGAVTVRFAAVMIGHRTVDPFFNVNRPGDLAAAEAVLGETTS